MPKKLIIIGLILFVFFQIHGQSLSEELTKKLWLSQIIDESTVDKELEILGYEALIFNDSLVVSIFIDSTFKQFDLDVMQYKTFVYKSGRYVSDQSINVTNVSYYNSQSKIEDGMMWFHIEPESLISIGNAKPILYDYFKFNIPFSLYEYLYQRYKTNEDFNVLQDFLNITVRSVCTPQLDVFNAVEGEKVGYLIQGDLVEVIQTQGDWVQIKYLKTDKVYWTYGSCLE